MFPQGRLARLTVSVVVLGCLSWAVGGCAGRTSLLPNSDKNLRKTSAQFAADAAKRQYPAEAPRGGEAQVQASIDHGFANRIEAINLSEEAWNDVDLWVNEKYVVHIPSWNAKELKQLNFTMLFDRDGLAFPSNNKAIRVAKVEVARGGKLYSVPAKLAD
jgi:L-lactate utilization protein LutC